MASCVAVVAIALAYAGKFRALPGAAAGRDTVVNLNAARDAAELEPALAVLYTHANDRQFAARALFHFLTADRAGRRNAAERRRGGARDRERRHDPRSADPAAYSPSGCPRKRIATGAGSGPKTLPLFTASDIATLKPYVTVRTRAAVPEPGDLALRLSTSWRSTRSHCCGGARNRRSDGWLLATAHLLTGIGFAVLLAPAGSVAGQPALRALCGNHDCRRGGDGRPLAHRVHGRRVRRASATFRSPALCHCRCS